MTRNQDSEIAKNENPFLTSSSKSTLGPALSIINPFASDFEPVKKFPDPGFWFSAGNNFTIGPRAENLKYEYEFLVTTPIGSAIKNQPKDFLDSSDETFEAFTEREWVILAEKSDF